MGKFGNKSLPKFMKDENDIPIGEDSANIYELQEDHSKPEIVSLGDADGGDFITITVKTVEGEEVALEFKIDDEKEETDEEGVYKGTLSAEHNEVVYTINCEIEEAGNGDYDIKIGDVTADMNAPEMDGDSEQMDEARVMRFGQFVSESWDVTDAYEGGDSECCGAPILTGGICSDCKEHTEPMETEDDDELPFFPHDPMDEAAIPAPLKKLGKWKPIEADEDLLDGTDYTKVSSFMLNTGTDLDDYGIIVNIYDDKDFSIFFDSAPIALTAHTSMQASRISQTMDEYPLPLSKLNRAELDKIINDLKSDYLGENLEDVNVEPNKKLEKAKMIIESMCNEYLINEALAYHEDEDDSHTYEGYVKSCMEQLKTCMTKEGQY
jgi:hypothetical protein